MKRSKPAKLPTLGKIKYSVASPMAALGKPNAIASAIGKESFSEKPKPFGSALSSSMRKGKY